MKTMNTERKYPSDIDVPLTASRYASATRMEHAPTSCQIDPTVLRKYVVTIPQAAYRTITTASFVSRGWFRRSSTFVLHTDRLHKVMSPTKCIVALCKFVEPAGLFKRYSFMTVPNDE